MLPQLMCMLGSMQDKGTLILMEPPVHGDNDVKDIQFVPVFAGTGGVNDQRRLLLSKFTL